jgi:hypothetical protein
MNKNIIKIVSSIYVEILPKLRPVIYDVTHPFTGKKINVSDNKNKSEALCKNILNNYFPAMKKN